MVFFRSQDLKMEIALKTLEYLYMETEYLPWKTAITELTYISNMLERTEIFGDFGVSKSYECFEFCCVHILIML